MSLNVEMLAIQRAREIGMLSAEIRKLKDMLYRAMECVDWAYTGTDGDVSVSKLMKEYKAYDPKAYRRIFV